MKISQLLLAVGLLAMLPAMGMMVSRDAHGYVVRDGNKVSRNIYGMDKSLTRVEHKMNPELYKKCVEIGLKVRPSRLSDGSYYLHDKSGLNGGGLFTAVIGGAITLGSGLVTTACTTALVAVTAGPPAAAIVCASCLGTTYSATAYVAGVGLALPTP